jgi:hypothetical protein
VGAGLRVAFGPLPTHVTNGRSDDALAFISTPLDLQDWTLEITAGGVTAAGSPGLVNPCHWHPVLLISFTTNIGDDNLFQLGWLPAHDKVGIGLHLAALAALAGDAQLAAGLRHRAANVAEGRRSRSS